MTRKRVRLAESYRDAALDAFSGTASHMLIRQSNFPLDYNADDESVMYEDHDRLLYRERDRVESCITQHTGVNNDYGLGDWFREATADQIMAFLIDLLQPASDKQWSGFRITATINPRNASIVWGFELFSRAKNSTTKVFSDDVAPNVRGHRSGLQARGR